MMKTKHLLLPILFISLCMLPGCSDTDGHEEPTQTRIYPAEEQSPFEVTNGEGVLMQDEESWYISSHDIPGWKNLGDEDWGGLRIDNLPAQYAAYKGDSVTYSGQAIYLYNDQTRQYGLSFNYYVFSLEITELAPKKTP